MCKPHLRYVTGEASRSREADAGRTSRTTGLRPTVPVRLLFRPFASCSAIARDVFKRPVSTLANVVKKTQKNNTGKGAPDDAELFRAAVGTVRPLPKQGRITLQPAPRKPVLHPHVSPVEIPDTLSDFATEDAADEYLGNGLSRMTLRKLRRGGWPIQDSLDLHGDNSDAARKSLQEFLYEAMQRKLRCVLVIHGKGLNSQGGEAVLRRLTRHWLAQHSLVLGFCDAPAKDGGSGAVLVLLRVGA
jgi:DNA-nicking Smr family endonuclease